MNKKRSNGYYWVQLYAGKWIIVEYFGSTWSWQGCSYDDNHFKKIDEKKLIRDEV
jgi:hypothetical protein